MLNSKQKQYLKRLAHHLKPVVFVGKNGIEPMVITALDLALVSHELIKVKLQESCDVPKAEAAEILAKAGHAQLVSIIGRTIILYRNNPDEPKIVI